MKRVNLDSFGKVSSAVLVLCALVISVAAYFSAGGWAPRAGLAAVMFAAAVWQWRG